MNRYRLHVTQPTHRTKIDSQSNCKSTRRERSCKSFRTRAPSLSIVSIRINCHSIECRNRSTTLQSSFRARKPKLKSDSKSEIFLSLIHI